MRTRIVVVLSVLFLPTALPGMAASQPDEAPLFTGCRKVELQVEAPSFGDEEVIRSMAESSLRTANLYRTPHPTGARDLLSGFYAQGGVRRVAPHPSVLHEVRPRSDAHDYIVGIARGKRKHHARHSDRDPRLLRARVPARERVSM